MKKLLLFLCLIMCCSTANAGTIDLTDYISGNDVTIANMASDNTTLENFANGGVEGGVNIKEASIVSKDLSNAISPVTRWGEAFNDFTVTGMLPATSTAPDLDSDISAGTSYINGIRVVRTAFNKEYTAERDTYVYIHEGGSYLYEVETNGASAPTTPGNSLLLAKVVTDTDNITAVSDLRTTAIQLTLNSSSFASDWRTGTDLVLDSTTTLHSEPGHIAIGTANYTRTEDSTTIDMATAGDWIEASAPKTADFTNPVMYVYAYNDSGTSWDIKFSSTDPVNSSAGSGTDGILRYLTVGNVDYRLLGWAWVSADTVHNSCFSSINEVGFDNRFNITDESVHTAAGSLPFDNTKPQITEGDFLNEFGIKPTRANSRISIRVKSHIAGTGQRTIALFKNGGASAVATGICMASSNTTLQGIAFDYEAVASATTFQTYEVRYGGTSADGFINRDAAGLDQGDTIATSMTIQEF